MIAIQILYRLLDVLLSLQALNSQFIFVYFLLPLYISSRVNECKRFLIGEMTIINSKKLEKTNIRFLLLKKIKYIPTNIASNGDRYWVKKMAMNIAKTQNARNTLIGK